ETGNFPMNISLLKETIVEDRRLGFLPILCVANYGATNTCAVDPVHELGDLCRREGIMLHVDAAYSGSALMLEAFRDDALVIRTVRSIY
ncbi:aromatic amino acid decarboxylase, putative, partial [Perkinsus marinus ATCC 50983]